MIALLHAMVYGVKPDGTPWHQDNGTATQVGPITPTSSGVALPNIACKYLVLKNTTGKKLQWGLAASTPLFNLDIDQDERVNVSNANQLWLFDSTNSSLTFNCYAIT